MWWLAGGQLAGEFFAGWLTEYSLSVDNLFIFILIMASFSVPEKYQQFALMVGIVIAIVLRGIFIAVGAAAIENFSWIFYVFGAFLVYTAVKLASSGETDDDAVRAEPVHAPDVDSASPPRRSTTARSCSPGGAVHGWPRHSSSSSSPSAPPTCSSPSTRSRRSTG